VITLMRGRVVVRRMRRGRRSRSRKMFRRWWQ
jgi:hypothetical protein